MQCVMFGVTTTRNNHTGQLMEFSYLKIHNQLHRETSLKRGCAVTDL